MTNQPLPRLIAAAAALYPATAWAHGDHDGLHGLVHMLTEPLHLGALLLAGLGALLVGPRVKAMLRRRRERQSAEKARDD